VSSSEGGVRCSSFSGGKRWFSGFIEFSSFIEFGRVRDDFLLF